MRHHRERTNDLKIYLNNMEIIYILALMVYLIVEMIIK